MICLREFVYHVREYSNQIQELSIKTRKLITILSDFGTENIYVSRDEENLLLDVESVLIFRFMIQLHCFYGKNSLLV